MQSESAGLFAGVEQVHCAIIAPAVAPKTGQGVRKMTFTRAELLLLVAGMSAGKKICLDFQASALPDFLPVTERKWAKRHPEKSGHYKRTLFTLLLKLEDLGEQKVQAIVDGRARFHEQGDGVKLVRT
jgi:hypothetical protein